LILILIISGLALWIDFAPGDTWLGRNVATRLGLDLQGGTQVLLRAQRAVTPAEMQTSLGVINRRVNGLGVSEAVVQSSGGDRIVVELPGVSNPEEAIRTLRGAGQLEFIDSQGQYLPEGQTVRTSNNPNPTVKSSSTLTATNELSPTQPLTETVSGPVYPSITKGSELDNSQVQLRLGGAQTPGQNPYAATFAFTGESANALAQFTSQNVGKPMCIVLDNVIQSCPEIQSPLVNGSGEISTRTQQEAQNIYTQLKFGALPVSFDIESNRTVSASLGRESVDASIVAGIVGLSVVALFLILYYRLPGLIATIVLLFYTAVIFAIYRLIPVTLTLAGIAGFILSIGVIVDANVLIVGRLKEELRKGRSLRTAVESGFSEAWSAILDSSVAMLITSLILYMFGSSFGVSIIRGFAVTLFLGTLISLLTARGVTRTLLRAIAQWNAVYNPWLFDLSEAAGLERERRSEAAA
jgi:preprotein translocase subunit SecD